MKGGSGLYGKPKAHGQDVIPAVVACKISWSVTWTHITCRVKP